MADTARGIKHVDDSDSSSSNPAGGDELGKEKQADTSDANKQDEQDEQGKHDGATSTIPQTIEAEIKYDDDNDESDGDGDKSQKTKEKQDDDKENKNEQVDPQESFDEIKTFLESESGLDIYQLLAFRLKTGAGCCQDIDDDNFSVVGYYSDIFQCIVVTLTQLISLTIILYESISNSEKDWCNGIDDRADDNNDVFNVIITKIMVACYTLLLSSVFWAQVQSQTDGSGFYNLIDYKFQSYEWIDSRILEFGNFWNFVISIITVLESFLVIFYSESGLDVILNSVALLFIPEIDNMVVDTKDYSKCLQWFENVENGKNEEIKSVKQLMTGEKYETTSKFQCLYLILKCAVKCSGLLIVVLAPALAICAGVCY